MVAAVPTHAGQGAAKDHGHDHSHDHAHSHDHDHAHDHGDEVTKAAAKGYFDDDQIAPRGLSDWQGEWQSVYPLLLDGKLDAVMVHKAEHGDKTAAEYTDYYKTGYATDVERITVAGDRVTFVRDGKPVSARYADDGHEILTYKKGNRGVRFIFQKVEGDAEAPQFIQFSDHKIAPSKADHYHLYWGEDRAEVLKELTNWPTYYPAALTAEQVAEEMMAH
nr:metal-binding protein ZinT [Paracoccus xiamenensis]